MGKSSKRKKSRALTQEEIWDDSALINSWNEAVEEYHLYHSIAAKGENVKDVLRDAGYDDGEDDEDGEVVEGIQQDGVDRHLIGVAIGPKGELRGREDAQMKEGDIQVEELEKLEDGDGSIAGGRTQQSQTNGDTTKKATTNDGGEQTSHHSPPTSIPQSLLNTAQDENMKNLMMAWYYAGYYTGLHEGQLNAQRTTS